MEMEDSFEGGRVILIDKPLHWTSFDVIRKLRSLIKIKKIGHAGTLDPLATGLLIVCTGKFTKKINDYMSREKEYTGTFTLGATTPTYDLESEPQNFKEVGDISIDMLRETTKEFTGEISQVPPIHSAIKQAGKPVYILARKGIDVKLEPRKITVYEFEITKAALPIISFRVVCTTGTYIRSLANDFGAAIGCGAYLSSLCRTRIGEFTLDQSVPIDEFVRQIKEVKYDPNLMYKK
jgi:tRNA pseudouridine55 synthase